MAKENPAKEKEAKAPEKKPVEKPRTETKANPWNVLMYPHLAEKSMNMVEIENKLVFIVRMNSTKPQIKKAVESGFDVKVLGVKTEITRKGTKKAYVKLSPESHAADIASRLGMV